MKQFNLIQKFALVYAAGFLFVVVISHWPGLTDQQGLLLGFYHVSPLIDSVHFLAGVLAVLAAWHSTRWSIIYFKIAGPLFGLDAIISFLFGRDLLETFSIFTQGISTPNFSTTNILANLPHILISVVAVWIGFWLSRKKVETSS